MIVFLNGQFVSAKKAKVSIFDHGFLYGDGVFETMKSSSSLSSYKVHQIRGKSKVESRKLKVSIWQVKKHLQRLRQSAKTLNLDIPWSDQQLIDWISSTVLKNGFQESRIRLTITRGDNGFVFSNAKKPTICIVVQEIKSEQSKQSEQTFIPTGIKVITFSIERVLPKIKSISLLPTILARQKMEQAGAHEVLLVNRDGFVTEGSVSNFFIVKHGMLITPKDDILFGTTRDLILKIAKKICPISLRKVKKNELYQAEECFICNAPRGLVPVIKIDGKKVGEGKVGKLTKKLLEATALMS